MVNAFRSIKGWVASGFLAITLMTSGSVVAQEKEYTDVDWVALMPASDLDALMNRPGFINEIADGSEQDNLEAIYGNQEDKALNEYYSALQSTKVIEKFDGAAVRLPGFIVPLEMTDDQTVTEFFIVPYFGACLHMPPPPPNQIIHVEFKDGIDLPNLSDAYFFEGTLGLEVESNDLGTSAYKMNLDNLMPYYE